MSDPRRDGGAKLSLVVVGDAAWRDVVALAREATREAGDALADLSVTLAGVETGATLAALPGARVFGADDGHAAGAARAAAEAGGTVLAFLPASARPGAAWLPPLLEALRARGAAAACGRVAWSDGAADGLRLRLGAPWPLTFVPGIAGDLGEAPHPVDAAAAGPLLVDAGHFRTAGGLDPGLGWSAAVIDLSLRLRLCAAGLWCAPRSVATVAAAPGEGMSSAEVARLTQRWLERLSAPGLRGGPVARHAGALAPVQRAPVSVILAVHDGLEGLPDAADALARQLLPGDELVLADGGSTDGTAELAAALVRRWHGGACRAIRTDAAGAGEALAAGLGAATLPLAVGIPGALVLGDGALDVLAAAAGRSLGAVQIRDRLVVHGPVATLRPLLEIDPGAVAATGPERLRAAAELRGALAAGSEPGAPGDDHDLSDYFCAKPWEWFEVDDMGKVRACCPSWLPVVLGDCTTQDLHAVWNSPAAKAVRRSILDGSFRFCRRASCPSINGGRLPRKESLEDPRHRRIVAERVVEVDFLPRTFALCHDASCNLACPSCRTHRRTTPPPEAAARTERIHDVLDAALFRSPRPDHFTLQLSGAGDPFASRLTRRWLFGLDGADFPGLTVNLQTNGVMLTERTWERMSKLHRNIGQVWVSLDAACPETYAVTRRGGHWGQLLENLAFLDGLRRRGAIRWLRTDFVVQQRNYREMAAFVALVRRQCPSVDAICFNLIRDLGTFDRTGGFAPHAVWSPDHPEHADFLEVLRDPVFRSPGVLPGNMSPYLPPP